MRTTFDSSGAQPMTPAERAGYNAEPPVTLRSQVLRRPQPPPTEPATEASEGTSPTTAGADTGWPNTSDDEPAATGADEDVLEPADTASLTPETADDAATPTTVAGVTSAAYADVDAEPFNDSDAPEVDDIAQDEDVAGDLDENESRTRQLLGLAHEALPRRRRKSGPYVPVPAVQAQAKPSPRSRLAAIAARHWKPVLAVVAAAVLVVTVLATVVGHLVSDSNPAPTDPARVLAAQDPASDAVECPTTTDGAVSSGRGPGSQSSGVEVIRAFNFAYYRWRNAQAARSMVSLKGKVGDVIDMQSAIDLMAPGVRYCLAITDTGNNRYDVELTEISPAGSGAQRLIRQSVQTENIGGRWWITEFAKPQPKR